MAAVLVAELRHAVTTVHNHQAGRVGGHPVMPCWLVGAGVGQQSRGWVPSRGICVPHGQSWVQGATKLVLFQTGQLEPLLSHFSEEEELQMKRVLQRMDVLAKVRGPWGWGSHRGGHMEQAAL